MKKIYERAISNNDHFNNIFGNALPNHELQNIKYKANLKAVEELIYFK